MQNKEYNDLVMAALANEQDTNGRHLAKEFIQEIPSFQALKEISSEQIETISTWSPLMANFLAAVKLGRLAQLSQRSLLGHAYSSFELGSEMMDYFSGYSQESVCLVLTNVHNDILNIEEVFKGGPSECRLYPQQLYQRVLRQAAYGMAVVHNHPSGQVEPSQPDLRMIRRLNKGCQLLGIQFLDFMIIGHNAYYSWQENQQFKRRKVV